MSEWGKAEAQSESSEKRKGEKRRERKERRERREETNERANYHQQSAGVKGAAKSISVTCCCARIPALEPTTQFVATCKRIQTEIFGYPSNRISAVSLEQAKKKVRQLRK